MNTETRLPRAGKYVIGIKGTGAVLVYNKEKNAFGQEDEATLYDDVIKASVALEKVCEDLNLGRQHFNLYEYRVSVFLDCHEPLADWERELLREQ